MHACTNTRLSRARRSRVPTRARGRGDRRTAYSTHYVPMVLTDAPTGDSGLSSSNECSNECSPEAQKGRVGKLGALMPVTFSNLSVETSLFSAAREVARSSLRASASVARSRA